MTNEEMEQEIKLQDIDPRGHMATGFRAGVEWAQSKLEQRLKEAEDVIDDLVLSETHAEFCKVSTVKTWCTCMDNHYYSSNAILLRARDYQAKHSGGKEEG